MTFIRPGTTGVLAFYSFYFQKCRAFGLLAIVLGKVISTPRLQGSCIMLRYNSWKMGINFHNS